MFLSKLACFVILYSEGVVVNRNKGSKVNFCRAGTNWRGWRKNLNSNKAGMQMGHMTNGGGKDIVDKPLMQ